MEILNNLNLTLFKKYALELVFISLAIGTGITSVLIYLQNENRSQSTDHITNVEKPSPTKEISLPPTTIMVDIAGAVMNPNTYEVTAGSRLKHVFDLAGGLSLEADRGFFGRNFNLSKTISDQEKIYIPSMYDISTGLFKESERTLEYLQPKTQSKTTTVKESSSKLSINSASVEEIDKLPSIGKVTAEKIIKSRPYDTLDQLVSKKVLTKTVYDKIKNSIQL